MIPPAKNAKKDMISDLPDCVILLILSLLNSEEAVRTCILSLRWKDLWKRLPLLKFHKPKDLNSTIFANFVSNVLSLRDSSISLHALDFKHKFGVLEPHILDKIADYAISHNVQRLRLSVIRCTAQIPTSLCSSQTLTHLKISIWYDGVAQISLSLPALTYLKLCVSCEKVAQFSLDLPALTYLRLSLRACRENLFPKSLYLPSLTTLQVEHFTFCAGDDGCAEPFSTFNKLKSLLINHCDVERGARTLRISNAMLVNLTICIDSYDNYDKIDLCTPSLCAFAFHGFIIQNISWGNISSLKDVTIDAQLFPYGEGGNPLFIFNWLLEFANITSLTVTASTLQILNLIPGVLNFNNPSLGKLKSLKVNVDEIQNGVRLKLCKDKLQNVKSKREAARIERAYAFGLEPSPAVPDGIVNFLLHNSPSAEVDFVDCTKKQRRWRHL
ncbi:putative FBD-associated F-box protein At5g38570 [Vicia villosa]|uniref:putative FBD-associated F-box protein At5g38570 n=1 Tax=Vicia villosa TaxID=3911 RepID=UPI00273BFCA9|nr:putative FBD-associated F-box protein At5g38570 [Vicia villosa]